MCLCCVTERGATHQVHHLQALQQLTVAVLEAVGLVDDHAAPVELLQLGAVGHDHLEGGDHPVELQHPWDGVPLGEEREKRDR